MPAPIALAYSAFAWLTLGGLVHFIVDVAAQALRGAREPGYATTQYWGLHTAFALGQVVFGLVGILIARHAAGLLHTGPFLLVAALATAGWFAVILLFSEYKQPLFWVIGFPLLLVAMALSGARAA